MNRADISKIARLITEDPDINNIGPGNTLESRRAYFGISEPANGRVDSEVIQNTLDVQLDSGHFGDMILDTNGVLVVFFENEAELNKIVDFTGDLVHSYCRLPRNRGVDLDYKYDITLSENPQRTYRGDSGWPKDLPQGHGSGIVSISVIDAIPERTNKSEWRQREYDPEPDRM